ncbi:NAC transcription factor 32-like [Argentina anserina]|uniref:NAC transcription factor 32-like n=1 Tax=Argentina anserina TaxID=57926 RepID=UPI0021763D00|nr:NAC transcription factor 32-like [Potentilla anserina]
MSSPSKSPTMEPVQESHPHLKASVSQVSTSSGSPSPKQLQEQTEHEASFTRTKDAIVAPSVGTVVDHRFSEEEEQLNNFNNNLKRQQDAFLKSFPPGYRFNPRDDELVQHYLLKKILNEPLPPNKIMEVNLYRHNPETLAENYETYGEKEWYFFTPRDRKYRNGRRPNRAAGDGYWKATGADKFIWSGRVKIGCRKALVFYRGKPPKGKKTSWIMHEYRVPESHTTKRTENDMRLDNWVLCRIYKKKHLIKSVLCKLQTQSLLCSQLMTLHLVRQYAQMKLVVIRSF